jgi:SAM-dependent methyltransferase
LVGDREERELVINLKRASKRLIKRLPDQGRFVKSTLLKLQMRKEVIASNLYRRVGLSRLPNAFQVYWVHPSRITYHTNLENSSPDWEDWVFDQGRPIARVQDGDWDKPLRRVSEMRVFRAIEERIRHGVSWESTDFYKDAVRQIEGGRELWMCSDRASFSRRCDDIDRLVDSISSGGYVHGEMYAGSGGSAISRGGYQEILVNVGRDGMCLFQDGRHRLAIAQALNIDAVPVQVLVRHSEWQSFRELMWRMALSSGGASKKGSLYQSPMHFDLEDIPSEHGCRDRWEAIKRNLPEGNGSNALDIGCNLGFFCHRLETHGYSCVGVEYLPEIAFAAQKIALAEGKRSMFIAGDILAPETLSNVGRTSFSLVIALNIFHHFIKSEERFNRLREFLRRIRANTMIFEPHLQNESQMEGVFYNPSPTEFVKLISEWGHFRTAVPIFTAGDGRTVFKLTR